jgi:Subtilase family
MLAVAHRAEPFPSSTGRGLRVAVIDSGVNPDHPHILRRPQQVSLAPFASPHDEIGHGTAVMAAIQEWAPEADFFALKVFGPSLRASADSLAQAMEWAISNDIDIINLSLGTPNPEHRPMLQALVDWAVGSRKLIVAARLQGEKPVMPGALPGVLGVEGDAELPRSQYLFVPSVEGGFFRASVYPRAIPGLPRERNLNGVSFAVANMSGFAIRACEAAGTCSFDTVRGALRAEAAVDYR